MIYFPRGKWHAHLLFRLGSAKLIIYLKKVLSQLPHRILAPETIPFERKVCWWVMGVHVCVCVHVYNNVVREKERKLIGSSGEGSGE